ncbi:MAG: hypothetical protein AABZ53_07300 [Planctomycetota bacterium]
MDEIYVGYLPVPPGIRRFLLTTTPVIAGLVIAAAYLVATTQRSPGRGVWEDSTSRTFTGVVVCDPYPMLNTMDRGDGSPGVMMLVEGGKHGSKPRMLAFNGKSVKLSGTVLKRDGRRMVELDEGAGAVTLAELPAPIVVPPPQSQGRVTLRGEIVDSKCYLGAMKPGEGKTHKECAILCISGGIPPMLVTREPGGLRTYYLLLDPSGASLAQDALPFIADEVEVSGELETQGDVRRLRLRASDIRRL